MFVFEWHSQSQEAMNAKRAILEYLEGERSEECDMVLAGAILEELLDNVARCGPLSAKIAASWRADGTAIVEILELEPGAEPSGVAATASWGLMVAGALNNAITVEPGSNGRGDQVRAVLPIKRR